MFLYFLFYFVVSANINLYFTWYNLIIRYYKIYSRVVSRSGRLHYSFKHRGDYVWTLWCKEIGLGSSLKMRFNAASRLIGLYGIWGLRFAFFMNPYAADEDLVARFDR